MKRIITACPVCGAKVAVEDLHPEVEHQLSGLDRTYISCPECGFETTVCITSPNIRDLMMNRQKLQAQYNAAPSEAVHGAIEMLTERIKSEMDALNHR